MTRRFASLLVLAIAANVLPGCETLDQEQGGGRPQQPQESRIEIRSRNRKGPVLYVLAGDTLRTPGDGRTGDWFREGPWLRRGGKDGKKVWHFARGELRQAGPDGPVMLTFRGNRILRGASEEVLFVVRDGEVRRSDKDGTRVIWADPDMPDWAVAMALQGLY